MRTTLFLLFCLSYSIVFGQKNILGNDTTLCEGNLFLINLFDLNAQKYTWQDGQENPFYVIQKSGDYSVTATFDSYSISDTIHVTFAKTPNIELGNDTILCQDKPFLLSVKNPNSTFQWSSGENTASINVSKSGIYKVKATIGNCVAEDSITVTFFNQKNFSIGKDTVLCEGDLLIKNLSYLNADKYVWQDENTNDWFLIQKPGLYSVTATFGVCHFSSKFKVEYHKKPSINLLKDTAICENKNILLNALNNENYKANFRWSNGEDTPHIFVNEADTYWVEVNQNGCKATDTIKISQKECTEFQLYAPNVFSPNADTNNDEWKIFVHPKYQVKQFSLQIFDKWGNKVFATNDINQGWDGKSEAQNEKIGAFTYLIDLVYDDIFNKKEENYKTSGNINILR